MKKWRLNRHKLWIEGKGGGGRKDKGESQMTLENIRKEVMMEEFKIILKLKPVIFTTGLRKVMEGI